MGIMNPFQGSDYKRTTLAYKNKEEAIRECKEEVYKLIEFEVLE